MMDNLTVKKTSRTQTAAGQSAIEYLMTYGWMLLVVAVVGGSIFSITGQQSIESTNGFESNDIQIDQFGLTPSSLQLRLDSYGQENIEVNQVKISQDGKNITIPLNHEVSSESSTLNLPHFVKSSETNTIEIEMVYDSGGLENITSSGTVTGNLQLDDSMSAYWIMDQSQSNTTHIMDISEGENHARIEGPNFTANGNSLEFDGEDDYLDIPDDSRIHQALEGEESTFLIQLRDGNYGDSWTTWFAWTSVNDKGSQYSKFSGQGLNDNLYMRWHINPASNGKRNDGSTWARNTVGRGGKPMMHTSIFESTNTGYRMETWIDSELNDRDELGDEKTVLGDASNIRDFNPQSSEIERIMMFDRALSEDEVRSLYNNPYLIQ